jgi:hypothetical protein
MSKELIERLRADAESTDDIGLCADAADRIEELERDLLNLVCRIHRDGGHYIAKYGEAKAIADADTVAAQNNADLDALQADNARLRESTELLLIARQIGHYRDEWDMLKEALATPEQSLAAYRNKVIEECAKRAEAYAYMSQNFNALAEELRAMKEQP